MLCVCAGGGKEASVISWGAWCCSHSHLQPMVLIEVKVPKGPRFSDSMQRRAGRKGALPVKQVWVFFFLFHPWDINPLPISTLIYLSLKIFLCLLLPSELPNLLLIPGLKTSSTSVNLKMLGACQPSPSISLVPWSPSHVPLCYPPRVSACDTRSKIWAKLHDLQDSPTDLLRCLGFSSY